MNTRGHRELVNRGLPRRVKGPAPTMKALLIVLVCLLLPGCATLTVATIGAAVGVGLFTGAGKFAGENTARYAWKRHIAYRKCRHHYYRGDEWGLRQCIYRYTHAERG